MADYINLADLWGDPFDYIIDNAGSAVAQVFVDRVKALPAADVVEVVRCRECATPYNHWTGCPKLGGLVTPPEFYCAFGKRKDGDGDG